MERDGDEIHLTEIEACGGEKNHHVRYILGISLLAVTLLMSAIWILPALIG